MSKNLTDYPGWYATPVSLRDLKWIDANGKRRKWFSVRSFGRGRGCGILNTRTNTFVMFSRGGVSREEAKKALDSYTLEDYRKYWMLTNAGDAGMKDGSYTETDLDILMKAQGVYPVNAKSSRKK
jgi:hypothetical protein